MLSHSASRGSIERLRGFAAWFQDGLAFLSYSHQPLHAKIYALTRQSTLLEFRQFGNHQACNLALEISKLGGGWVQTQIETKCDFRVPTLNLKKATYLRTHAARVNCCGKAVPQQKRNKKFMST